MGNIKPIAFMGLLVLLICGQSAYGQRLSICRNARDGTRVPLPLDCRRYALCLDRNVAAIHSCPRGLHFNDIAQECDFQWRAKCNSLSLFAGPNTDDECVCTCCEEECNPTESTTPCAPTPESTTKSSNGDSAETDETDTTGPVETTLGTTKASNTVSTEAGNTDTTEADNTDTTEAGNTDTTEAGNTDTTEASNTDTTQASNTDTTQATNTDTTQASNTDSTESTNSTPPGDANTDATTATPMPTNPPSGNVVPSYCKDQRTNCLGMDDGTQLEMPGVCTSFIECSGGCCIEMPCPSGLYFDENWGACNYPYLVDCTPLSNPSGELVGPSGTTCTDQSVCAGQPEGAMFADPDSDGYIVCQCQCPLVRTCPTNTQFNESAQVCDWIKGTASAPNIAVLCPEGLVYNSTSDQCDYPANYVPLVVCENDSKVCQDQPQGALFPMDGVCNKFYKCNFNCATEQSCPNNLIYNATAEFCDFPHNVRCEWPYSPPTGPNAGPSGIACETNGRCLGQVEGTLFPSLTSCSNYTVCQCECEVEMPCADGLYWDITQNTCNYAYDVDCPLESD